MVMIINEEEAKELISMGECIDLMEDVFRELGRGNGVNPPRLRYSCPTPDPKANYFANIHAGALPKYGVAALRLNSRLTEEKDDETRRVEFKHPTGRYWGQFLIYSLETAELLGIIVDGTISPLRVGATSGAAVRLLARPDSHVAGLFGTGHQAELHALALAAALPLRRLKVYSPSRVHREEFCARFGDELGIPVVAATEPGEVVKGSDVICCATNSSGPVFDGEDLEPGQTVVSIVNSDVVFERHEVDRQTIVRSDLIVINGRESVRANRQKELLDPIEAGETSWDKVVELGELVNGTAPGRRDPADIIYYKNNSGMAIQFAAVGKMVLDKARANGVGRELPGEWFSVDLEPWFARGYSPAS